MSTSCHFGQLLWNDWFIHHSFNIKIRQENEISTNFARSRPNLNLPKSTGASACTLWTFFWHNKIGFIHNRYWFYKCMINLVRSLFLSLSYIAHIAEVMRMRILFSTYLRLRFINRIDFILILIHVTWPKEIFGYRIYGRYFCNLFRTQKLTIIITETRLI